MDHTNILATDERNRYAVRHGHGEVEIPLGGDQRVGLAGKARS
jgi:hypothetical protein